MPTNRANALQPDLTLLLDSNGTIREATSSAAMADEGLARWIGRPWCDTVGDTASDKVRAMIADACDTGVSAFRQITQMFPSGMRMPMEYTTVRLGGGAGLIAIGRGLRAVSELQSRLIAAQRAREQDYWKLREVETRYRLLFDSTREPVLLIAGDTLRVVEANPAALSALGVAPGWEILPEIAPQDVDAFQAMLSRVREFGRAPGILLHLGPRRSAWMVRASLLATEPRGLVLLQIATLAADSTATVPAARESIPVDALMQRMPDGFVVIDPSGVILRANEAFLDLAQIAAADAVRGQHLGRWLGMPGADVATLLAAVEKHRAVRLFPSRVRGEHDSETEVEVSAVGGSDARPGLIGVLMRDVSRRPVPLTVKRTGLDDALVDVAARLGQISLLQLVRDTTSLVERYAIEAALARSGGNRTAAAELLGLSRQSLYVKLRGFAHESGASQDLERAD